jgi:uncharacterized protein YqeY
MLVSAVKTLQIDKNVKSVEDPDVLQILKRQIKQRRESIEQFKLGNRQDLADKEAAELGILEAYLPPQMGDSDIEAMVRAAITKLGASGRADTGKVIKAVMEQAGASCDGKTVSRIVSGILK